METRSEKPTFVEKEKPPIKSNTPSPFVTYLTQEGVRQNLNANLKQHYQDKGYSIFQLNRIFNELSRKTNVPIYNNFPELKKAYSELIPTIQDSLKQANKKGKLKTKEDLYQVFNQTEFGTWINLALAIAIKDLFDENGNLLPDVYDALNNQKVLEEEHALDQDKLKEKTTELTTEDKRKAVKEEVKIRILSSYFVNISCGLLADAAGEDAKFTTGMPEEEENALANLHYAISQLSNIYQDKLERELKFINMSFIQSINKRMQVAVDANIIKSPTLKHEVQKFLFDNEKIIVKYELPTFEVLYKYYFLSQLNTFLQDEKEIIFCIQKRGAFETTGLTKENFLSYFDENGNFKLIPQDHRRVKPYIAKLNKTEGLTLNDKDGSIIDGFNYETHTRVSQNNNNTLQQIFANSTASPDTFKPLADFRRHYLENQVIPTMLGEILREATANKDGTNSPLFTELKPSDKFKTVVALKLKESQKEVNQLIKKGLLKPSQSPSKMDYIIIDSPKGILEEFNNEIRKFEVGLIKEYRDENVLIRKFGLSFASELKQLNTFLEHEVFKQLEKGVSYSKVLQSEPIRVAKEAINILNRLKSQKESFPILYIKAIENVSELINTISDKKLQQSIQNMAEEVFKEHLNAIRAELSTVTDDKVKSAVGKILRSFALRFDEIPKSTFSPALISMGYLIRHPEDEKVVLIFCKAVEELEKKHPNDATTLMFRQFNTEIIAKRTLENFKKLTHDNPKVQEELNKINKESVLMLNDSVKITKMYNTAILFLNNPTLKNMESYQATLNDIKSIPYPSKMFLGLAVATLEKDYKESLDKFSNKWNTVNLFSNQQDDKIAADLIKKKEIFIEKFKNSFERKDILDTYVATKILEEITTFTLDHNQNDQIVAWASHLKSPELKNAALNFRDYIIYNQKRDELKKYVEVELEHEQQKMEELKNEENSLTMTLKNPLIREIDGEDKQQVKQQVKKDFALKKSMPNLKIALLKQAQKIINETDKIALKDKPDISIAELNNVLTQANELVTKSNYDPEQFCELASNVSKIPTGRKIAGAMVCLVGGLLTLASVAVGVLSLGLFSPLTAVGTALGLGVTSFGASIAAGVTVAPTTGLSASYLFKKPDLKRTMEEMGRMKDSEQWPSKEAKRKEEEAKRKTEAEGKGKEEPGTPHPTNGSKH